MVKGLEYFEGELGRKKMSYISIRQSGIPYLESNQSNLSLVPQLTVACLNFLFWLILCLLMLCVVGKFVTDA